MANLADSIVFGDLTVTRDQLIKGTLTVEGLLTLTGNLDVNGTISGNGSGLTALNASNLSSGTVATARLPAAALVGDTTYVAGSGLSLSGTTFNVDNPFNPAGSYAGLRAQATTKADVGLGNVGNYSASESATASTVALRSSAGDLSARLFRSEYDTTNPTIGMIMTQVDTATNNYLRPSTPAQVKAALAIAAGDVSGLSDAATTPVASIRSGTTKADVGLSLVPNVDMRNASNLSSGTVATARLPAEALVGDTTYAAGTGLTLSGTTFNISNPFNPSGSYAGLRAQATTKADVGLSLVPNIDMRNASNLSSGTVPTARLPSAALVGDTTYTAGTGLSLTNGAFSVVNPFNPSGNYTGLRAQATTKADVGLGSARDVASYSQVESDSRYLPMVQGVLDMGSLSNIV